MPWKPGDALRHTKKADTAKKQRQFAHVANSMKARGKSDASAIRAANAVVGRNKSSRSRRRSSRQ